MRPIRVVASSARSLTHVRVRVLACSVRALRLGHLGEAIGG
jgi:hypothetical protein